MFVPVIFNCFFFGWFCVAAMRVFCIFWGELCNFYGFFTLVKY